MAETLQSLSKGLQVYKEILSFGRPIVAQELCDMLQMNKSTMSRVLKTLHDEGYISYLENSHEIIANALEKEEQKRTTIELLVKRTRPLLDEIYNLTGECAYLGIFDNYKVLYLNQIDHSNRAIKTRNNIGLQAPIHTNALGKSILAFGNFELEKVKLNAYTHHTITDMEALKQELNEVQNLGFSLDNSEFQDNMCCVAVPLFNQESILIGAVGISGSKTRLNKRRLHELGREISELVQQHTVVC